MQAKIYTAASKAAENPSIGITIHNPAASHVIKDCAMITMKCLPLYIFAEYKEPFKELAGKFTKQDIAEFVNHSKNNTASELLLSTILTKAQKEKPDIFKQTKLTESPLNNITDGIDPYGGYYSERIIIETKEKTTEDILEEAFKE